MALVCALGLALACTMSAYGAEEYPVMVSGVAVTSENADDVLGDSAVSFEWDATAEKGTLTLKGACITMHEKPGGS